MCVPFQVWFQNARAKFRRSLAKKEQDADNKKTNGDSSAQSAIDSHGSETNSPPDNTDGNNTGSDMGSPHGTSDDGCYDAMSPDLDDIHDDDDDDDDDDSPSYSDLKSASPALADEVSTIASMPTTGISSHVLSDSVAMSPIAQHTMNSMSSGFTPIFN